MENSCKDSETRVSGLTRDFGRKSQMIQYILLDVKFQVSSYLILRHDNKVLNISDIRIKDNKLSQKNAE